MRIMLNGVICLLFYLGTLGFANAQNVKPSVPDAPPVAPQQPVPTVVPTQAGPEQLDLKSVVTPPTNRIITGVDAVNTDTKTQPLPINQPLNSGAKQPEVVKVDQPNKPADSPNATPADSSKLNPLGNSNNPASNSQVSPSFQKDLNGPWPFLTGKVIRLESESKAKTETKPDNSSVASRIKYLSVPISTISVLPLPSDSQTLVIGNPLIADVSFVRANASLLITGRSFGTTDMEFLSQDGSSIIKYKVRVVPNLMGMIVYRGTERTSLSCNPNCVPTVALGDNADYMTNTLSAIANYANAQNKPSAIPVTSSSFMGGSSAPRAGSTMP